MQPNQTTKTQFKDNKKLRVFMTFLLLSILFWALIKLSKNYIAQVNFNVEYVNLPGKKLLQNNPPDQIKVTVNTTGFRLFNYAFKKENINYSLTEIKKSRSTKYYSITKENIKNIQAQLPAEVEVLKLNPDTIYFDLGNKKSKKVAIRSDLKLDFRTGFSLTKPYSLEPQFVHISGPAKFVDSIKHVDLESVEMSDIYDSFKREVKIIQPNQNVSLSQEVVQLSGEVAKITEGTFSVPFKILNLPKSHIITTYPKEVKVIYQVALKDYNLITENRFEVVCDYKQTTENNLDYLIPKLVEQPGILFDVKIIPNKIEYIVKK